jgi:hypothetical protein
MKRRTSWLVLIPLTALALGACQQSLSSDATAAPARVEAMDGSELSRVILTDASTRRLGIRTAAVESVSGSGAVTAMVPYSAVIYDDAGDTWVYTSTEPMTYVRHAVSIESIEGDVAYLTAGPAVGTAVVSVGSAELLGAEYKAAS